MLLVLDTNIANCNLTAIAFRCCSCCPLLPIILPPLANGPVPVTHLQDRSMMENELTKDLHAVLEAMTAAESSLSTERHAFQEGEQAKEDLKKKLHKGEVGPCRMEHIYYMFPKDKK